MSADRAIFPLRPGGKSCIPASLSSMVSAMRISGPGTTSTTSTRKTDRKGDGAGRAGFSRSLEGAPSAKAGVPAAQTGQVGAIDALLALQEAPDAGAGRSKGLGRAHEMLDMLEEVRRGILLGAIPREKLKELARLSRAGREAFTDPMLAGILDEIELRAEVELAKLEQKD